jgi:adenylate cyclase
MHDLFPQLPMRDEQRVVTLLFADLRDFTELAGSLEADPLFCELLSHVMDCLTEAVVHHNGFVIDYCGDGLVAMWNAPADQPEHAELACHAGLEMLDTLPAVAAEWFRLIHTELRLGIGVHTGEVQVGNAGSTRRVKYGARGPSMHLASRVEAATKELRAPLLATRATVERLSETFAAHRVCRAQLPGLRQPVDLYTVGTRQGDASRATAWQVYDRALCHFEQGRYHEAADTLASVGVPDAAIPSQFLLERVHRELSRSLRRRSTDKPMTYPGGVIALSAK